MYFDSHSTLCLRFYFVYMFVLFFFFKQKTAYEMRISDWSSDVCSSDLLALSTAVREKRLKLEGADFPWQLSQAKVGCVPALHLVSPVIGADTIRLKK